MMLTLKEVNVSYGKLHILRDISLQVGQESVGLFGPNGAGKTTLINTLLGIVTPTSGDITFAGDNLLALKTHQRIQTGIAVVPQERELFPTMSVLENLNSGALHNPRARHKVKEQLEIVVELFPVLRDRFKQLAGTMSGGQQRMLAIGRALMADPRLLILDEPSGGLQPSIVSELFERLGAIKTKVAILVAEQNVRQCLKAIDRGYVIENGRVVMEDNAGNLKSNDHIRKSYLGI
jgi:branched-chain amino acid transport system ATP-binding protein